MTPAEYRSRPPTIRFPPTGMYRFREPENCEKFPASY